MDLPKNTSLPFFAYGIFKQGQISYFRIKHYISKIETTEVVGQLHIRDGITIINIGNIEKKVAGNLIWFKDASAKQAYQSICELEPKKYYKWSEIDTVFGRANILNGIKPTDAPTEDVELWDSWSDSLFTEAFEVIDETIQQSENDNPVSGKQFIRLQMAYMLLWTAIERFLSLRYNFTSEGVTLKVSRLAEEPLFSTLVKQGDKKYRRLHSADDVSDRLNFDRDEPVKCVKYFYKLRSNITHRGKASIQDAILVKDCLIELTSIFKKILEDAKAKSSS